MAFYLLFLGGFIGWSLFITTVIKICFTRKKELRLIKEIKLLINEFKKEINKPK